VGVSDWATPGGSSAPGDPTPFPAAPPTSWGASPGAWGGAPSVLPSGRWRALSGLAIALRILLILAAVVAAVRAVLAVWLLSALEDARGASPAQFSDPEAVGAAEDAVTVFFATASLSALAVVAVVVVFIIWMWRAAKNIEVLGRRGASFGPGWAIGGWLIPIANLVLPVLHMQELWKASDPTISREDGGWKYGAQSSLIWLWWVAYAAAQVLGTLGGVVISSPDRDGDLPVVEMIQDLDAVRTGVTIFVVGQLLLVVAAILAVLVVLGLTRRQTEAASALGTGVGGYGAWAPVPPGMATSHPTSPAAWHPDPTGRYELRYWDGSRWTEHVSRRGDQFEDAL
jgi:hypothetical protein